MAHGGQQFGPPQTLPYDCQLNLGSTQQTLLDIPPLCNQPPRPGCFPALLIQLTTAPFCIPDSQGLERSRGQELVAEDGKGSLTVLLLISHTIGSFHVGSLFCSWPGGCSASARIKAPRSVMDEAHKDFLPQVAQTPRSMYWLCMREPESSTWRQLL